MQAKISRTTTGVKSFLLKFADPIFSKGGKGAVVPIKITGSVKSPHYGLDLGHKYQAAKEKINSGVRFAPLSVGLRGQSAAKYSEQAPHRFSKFVFPEQSSSKPESRLAKN